jgi:hypothetical protein
MQVEVNTAFSVCFSVFRLIFRLFKPFVFETEKLYAKKNNCFKKAGLGAFFLKKSNVLAKMEVVQRLRLL